MVPHSYNLLANNFNYRSTHLLETWNTNANKVIRIKHKENSYEVIGISIPSYLLTTLRVLLSMYCITKFLTTTMSAHDVLDVLNLQRDDLQQPAKKKARAEATPLPKSGISRELYNLIGANTPSILVNMGNNRMKDRKLRVSPWTKMPFVSNPIGGKPVTLHHWEKGAKELLTESSKDKPYYFDKFVVSVDVPEMVEEPLFDQFMVEIVAEQNAKRRSKQGEKMSDPQRELSLTRTTIPQDSVSVKREPDKKEKASEPDKDDEKGNDFKDVVNKENKTEDAEQDKSKEEKIKEDCTKGKDAKEIAGNMRTNAENDNSDIIEEDSGPLPWTYDETKLLFQYCKDFELKWFVINDRFPAKYGRTLEDLEEQFYAMCVKIMSYKAIGNPTLIDSLRAFSKPAEIERKNYLSNLLRRTPTEIAEESLLVIEARRFEMAAKKMLQERANLLTLLDLPQAAQSVLQYQSSQGLSNLYSQLMIMDKNQRKKSQQKMAQTSADPVPPPIPLAASSSHKRDFQTHLQQYLSGFLKQLSVRPEDNAIQQLLAKKLTAKEEEAYGLYYHASERLTPGVLLRSTQRLSGLQQRQSVFKAVNNMLQEMDIPTAGGTTWKPNMPTRKTMAKYDELTKAVVALLEVKKGKDKMEAEIELIKSQRGI